MGNTADGFPTKDFFVDMLTRDIELNDAILDLLDNCLDGVVRMKGVKDKRDNLNYYSGYFAEITVTSSEFKITDNCGGIPRKDAEKYAFRMGKSPEDKNSKLPTVGIYGIGMKRAIFKIGRCAKVLTRNNEKLYSVNIPVDWVENEKNWSFNIYEENAPNTLTTGGTTISISSLNEGIKNEWSNNIERFIESLIKSIQNSYSLIIKKGFKININNKPVRALPIELLISEQNGIKPYFYKQEFDGVSVNLVVGFYAPPPSTDEIDDENEMKRHSSENAGWTVVCNDRVVLYNDKTHLSGWGEAGVPNYHTQFIAIRGFVFFESSDPEKLPMTTTKRGIDLSSPIYAIVKDRMREGVKLFTNYTNKWKGQNELERTFSNQADKYPIESMMLSNNIFEKKYGINYKTSKKGMISVPELPMPPNDKPYKLIRFSRDLNDINLLREFFYQEINPDITPSKIGEDCFDYVKDLAEDKEKIDE